MHLIVDSGTHHGPLSSALARTFRGKLCDVMLRDRSVATFEKDQVIYDVGDENQTFFFLQKGFVKVGSRKMAVNSSTMSAKLEMLWESSVLPDSSVRSARSRLNEPRSSLCLSTRFSRSCRRTDISYRNSCRCFARLCAEAYDQLNTLASSDTVHRLVS